LEVKLLPDNIADDCSCHEIADKDGRLLPAVEKALEQNSSKLPDCWTEQLTGDSSPPPSEQSGLPSNSLHLPRAGGGGRRRPARGRQHLAGKGAHVTAAEPHPVRPRLGDEAPSSSSAPTSAEQAGSSPLPIPSPPRPAGGEEGDLTKSCEGEAEEPAGSTRSRSRSCRKPALSLFRAMVACRSSTTARGTTPNPPARSKPPLLRRGPNPAEAHRPATLRLHLG
jgi:hypothetical protein